LVYDFADLVKDAREKKIQLNATAATQKMIGNFLNESIDFRGKGDLSNDGLPVSSLIDFLQKNFDAVTRGKSKKEIAFATKLIGNVDRVADHLYLATFRSIKQRISCVYGVVKDTKNKRIILVFRGSETGNDWYTNIQIILKEMHTPKLIREKMEKPLNESVSVHQGFYNYLFNNSQIEEVDGIQRYEQIRKDVKPLLKGEEGYSLYVTGHSLGGALATLMSFKLAGSNKEWIPRPVTAVTYASPYTGNDGYRKAFGQCEKDGLLRHLRIALPEDLITEIPALGVGRLNFLTKHVGINLQLKKHKSYSIQHHTLSNFGTALRQFPVKASLLQFLYHPVGNPHSLQRYYNRLIDVRDDLTELQLDDLYQDNAIVSKEFTQTYAKLEVITDDTPEAPIDE